MLMRIATTKAGSFHRILLVKMAANGETRLDCLMEGGFKSQLSLLWNVGAFFVGRIAGRSPKQGLSEDGQQ